MNYYNELNNRVNFGVLILKSCFTLVLFVCEQYYLRLTHSDTVYVLKADWTVLSTNPLSMPCQEIKGIANFEIFTKTFVNS